MVLLIVFLVPIACDALVFVSVNRHDVLPALVFKYKINNYTMRVSDNFLVHIKYRQGEVFSYKTITKVFKKQPINRTHN